MIVSFMEEIGKYAHIYVLTLKVGLKYPWMPIRPTFKNINISCNNFFFFYRTFKSSLYLIGDYGFVRSVGTFFFVLVCPAAVPRYANAI